MSKNSENKTGTQTECEGDLSTEPAGECNECGAKLSRDEQGLFGSDGYHTVERCLRAQLAAERERREDAEREVGELRARYTRIVGVQRDVLAARDATIARLREFAYRVETIVDDASSETLAKMARAIRTETKETP